MSLIRFFSIEIWTSSHCTTGLFLFRKIWTINW